MNSTQSPPLRDDGREVRFRFGLNWASFSNHVDEDRILEARKSLTSRLGDVAGLRCLDAGCGSGLFSLAMTQLGGARVHSFDYDADSVAATLRLKDKFAPAAPHWTIEQGDVLDRSYVGRLGEWDVVYAWGVLHHTGDMRRAWENVAAVVAPDGRLFISIYNDQGLRSRLWTRIKRGYFRVPPSLRPAYVVAVMAPREALFALAQGPHRYVRSWREYKKNRGMSPWHDLVDWAGGYPFEVAKPEEVFDFFHARGFMLEAMTTCGGGLGCNEFVLRRAGQR